MVDIRARAAVGGQPGAVGAQTVAVDFQIADPQVLAVDVLADTLTALALELAHQDDLDSLLGVIVSAAVALVPGAEGGSISMVTARRQVAFQASTSDLAARVDAIQQETQQGPGLDAIFEHHTIRVANLAAENRWPLFAQRASRTGVASMLSLQLLADGRSVGALNLHSRRTATFSDESEHVGILIATHAAIAYASARRQAQLAEALTNRDVIGQAKGILIARHRISDQEAFTRLTKISQDTNRKLHAVAYELVHSTLPA